MPHYLFSNNASSILATDLAADALDNVIIVQPDDGGLFPTPDANTNQYFYVTLQDDSGNVEVCLCIARTDDRLQVTRAVDGTTLRAWSSTLTRVELRLTAAGLENMVQEEMPYVPSGTGVEFYDSGGSVQARVHAKQDPAQPTKILLDVSGDDASVALSSSQELQLNGTPWPTLGAPTNEGDVPEVSPDGRTLVWQPRGHQVLDQNGAILPRRTDIQFLDSSVADVGSRIQVRPLIGFVGEVRMFAQDAVQLPLGWLPCDGRALSKSTYNELYTTIGGAYGETGSTFDIPDIRDRFVVSTGSGYSRGNTGGSDQVTLSNSQMPSHVHLMFKDDGTDVSGTPGSNDNIMWKHDITLGQTDRSYNLKATQDTGEGWRGRTEEKGQDQPHENRPPYIALVYAIFTNVF